MNNRKRLAAFWYQMIDQKREIPKGYIFGGLIWLIGLIFLHVFWLTATAVFFFVFALVCFRKQKRFEKTRPPRIRKRVVLKG